jgi:hypothetical protein
MFSFLIERPLTLVELGIRPTQVTDVFLDRASLLAVGDVLLFVLSRG